MIKIAAMVGAPDLSQETLAVFSGDMHNAFHQISQMGYDGIELMIRNPQSLDGYQIKRWLADEGLQLVGLCTGHVYGEDRLGLVEPDVQVCRQALQRLKKFIEFAGEVVGPGTLVNIGRARGMGIPNQPSLTLQKMAEAFHLLAEYAATYQVTLVLEPININQATYIHTTQDGIEMVDRVNHPNFRLMVDTYHMNIEDVNIFTSLIQAGDRLKFVHFSDNNRKYPGNGHLDFKCIIQTLGDIRYDGFVSLEIFPLPSPEQAASLSIVYLRQFIPKI
jgi:sugar phosphate isomerase/epimerase